MKTTQSKVSSQWLDSIIYIDHERFPPCCPKNAVRNPCHIAPEGQREDEKSLMLVMKRVTRDDVQEMMGSLHS